MFKRCTKYPMHEIFTARNIQRRETSKYPRKIDCKIMLRDLFKVLWYTERWVGRMEMFGLFNLEGSLKYNVIGDSGHPDKGILVVNALKFRSTTETLEFIQAIDDWDYSPQIHSNFLFSSNIVSSPQTTEKCQKQTPKTSRFQSPI